MASTQKLVEKKKWKEKNYLVFFSNPWLNPKGAFSIFSTESIKSMTGFLWWENSHENVDRLVSILRDLVTPWLLFANEVYEFLAFFPAWNRILRIFYVLFLHTVFFQFVPAGTILPWHFLRPLLVVKIFRHAEYESARRD